jgi:hypothetical protein
MPQAIMNQDQTILFNFKWSRWRIQQMHELSRHRGIAASAIIKDLLIQQFKADGIDPAFQNPTTGEPAC